MNVLTFEEVRDRLGEVMEAVATDHNPVVVTRQDGEAVVLVSLADWRSREETEHLLSTPRNAERLFRAIATLRTTGET